MSSSQAAATTATHKHVAALIAQHGIAVVRTPLDDLAAAITAHSGDAVTLDETVEMIIACSAPASSMAQQETVCTLSTSASDKR